ncbi:MAG: carboxypeptidase-like regulatory domain-containing protein [Flavobacteriaceae bacterium]
MVKKIILYSLCFTLFACPQKDDGIACTEEFVYGLSIAVYDNATAQPITQNITVTAIDGAYSEELMRFPEGTNFVGAGERPGTYIIQISAEGYQEYTSEAIVVEANECHVIPEARNFEMYPL